IINVENDGFTLSDDCDNLGVWTTVAANLHGMNYSDNILDVSDVPANIDDLIINRIEMDYSYRLMEQTPNSVSSSSNPGEIGNQGRLTLEAVRTAGRNGENSIPGLAFTYFDFADYDEQDIDSWGYLAGTDVRKLPEVLKEAHPKPFLKNGNLSEILLPEGGKITIDYESDTYDREAFLGTREVIDFQQLNLSATPMPNISNPTHFVLDLNEAEFEALSPYMPVGTSFMINVEVECFDYSTNTEYTTTHSMTAQISAINAAANELEITFNGIIPTSTGNTICTVYDATISHQIGNYTPYGGGTRVREIVRHDLEGNQYTQQYTYAGGATSYRMGRNSEEIPYFQELPGPGVMYGTFETETISALGQSGGKRISTFEEIENRSTQMTEKEFAMGEHLYIEDMTGGVLGTKADDYEYANNPYMGYEDNIWARVSVIHDKSKFIGRPLTMEKYSPLGTMMKKTEYQYYNYDIGNTGKYQETFSDVKVYTHRHTTYGNPTVINISSDWYFTSTSKISYPSVLRAITEYEPGTESRTEFGDFDLYTAKAKRTIYIGDDGEQVKHQVSFLHEDVTGMGPKVANPQYTNQLNVVGTATTSFSEDDGASWEVTDATAQTWNNNWNFKNHQDGTPLTGANLYKIHLPAASFSWKGFLNPNGSYQNYTPFDPANPTGNQWKKIGQATEYDLQKGGVEVEDLSNRYTAIRVGYQDYARPIAQGANARQAEIAYSGAEDYDAGSGYFGGEVRLVNGTVYQETQDRYDLNDNYRSDLKTHTGDNSVRLGGGTQEGFRYTQPLVANANDKGFLIGRDYRAAVWVRSESGEIPEDAILYAQLGTGQLVEASPDAQTIRAGEHWYLLTLDIKFSSFGHPGLGTILNIGVKRETGVENLYFDDFRVHPVNSPLASSVYDKKTGDAIATLDQENFSTIYRYDSMGRLIWTYRETQEGFQKVMNKTFNYSRNP
ncbi:MAG: hypothetical protein AAFP92_32320, partial [Bacteroidota bacterium]